MSRQVSSHRVRLSDVAKLARVHRTVAGKALLGGESNTRISKATIERIRKAAKKLDYKPNQAARQLRGVRSRLVGVLVSSGLNEASFNRLQQIEAECRRRGYRIAPGFVTNIEQDVLDYLNDFEARNIEAVIHVDTVHSTHHQALSRSQRVVYCIKPHMARACCVELDRKMSGHLQVQHLHERGRKKIGLLMTSIISYTAALRHMGFLEGMKKHFDIDASQMVWTAPANDQDPASRIGQAVDKLVGDLKCDAIITGNDRWAVILIEELRRRGLNVPSDVAVIGHNNAEISRVVTPYLTTIDQQHPLLASQVLDMVEVLIEHGKIPTNRRHILVPPQLVVREST